VGGLFQVDLDNLHKLGSALAGHADAIGKLTLTAKVQMPGSPVQAVSDKADDAVAKAFGVIGTGIRRMADASTNAADAYDVVDQTFAGQRRQYASGH
jgi:hypothetical protein